MLNIAQIPALLRPGLAMVFGMYEQYPEQWQEIFQTYQSDKAVEYEEEMRFTGVAPIRAEGAPTEMDQGIGQRFTYSYRHRYISLGLAITRQAVMDNLYQSKFPMYATALYNSLKQTRNILGAAVLNNGFDNNYPIGDGQPLFATDHPIDGGTIANKPGVPTDLNEAALEQGIIAIQAFRDLANMKVQINPKKLLTGANQQFNSERILKSVFRTNTANNDINAMYSMRSIPEGHVTNQFINVGAGNSWFILTDCDNSLKFYRRESLQTDSYTDFSTDNVMTKATERYSFGVSNWRGAYGSEAA